MPTSCRSIPWSISLLVQETNVKSSGLVVNETSASAMADLEMNWDLRQSFVDKISTEVIGMVQEAPIARGHVHPVLHVEVNTTPK